MTSVIKYKIYREEISAYLCAYLEICCKQIFVECPCYLKVTRIFLTENLENKYEQPTPLESCVSCGHFEPKGRHPKKRLSLGQCPKGGGGFNPNPKVFG